ncbi:uncharacterized protein LOC124898581 [Capsicum annuum]|uniref:uncharacterized protein LOC124898581 n=1 Tax=Capsicum annuum TaxID=4072 RepID=UPI001FB0E86B|nr:uncharacterized protein LOC124898581 [Capsicum annuum]
MGEDIAKIYPEWKLFFNGAVNFKESRIRAVLMSKIGQHYPTAAKLSFLCTNNMDEYEACILGLKLTLDMGIHDLLVIGNSDLLIHQIKDASYRAITKKVVAYFVKNNLICRFGLPESIITDNGANLNNRLINGVVEATNKNIKKILRKIVEKDRSWHEILPYAMLGYRITVRTSTGATPYLLVYGNEVVIPVEVEIPSLRIIQEAKLSNKEWVRARYEQLMLIDEKRMVIVCYSQLYQYRMIRAFKKKVRARIFKVGQLVLKRIFPHQEVYKGKFSPNWQRPYIIRKVLSGGALIISEMDGQEWTKPINSDVVKRYYI